MTRDQASMNEASEPGCNFHRYKTTRPGPTVPTRQVTDAPVAADEDEGLSGASELTTGVARGEDLLMMVATP